ncbi:hypothetical protein Taro_027363 [Colocasia esculenta]|uniref:Uncharacterized protein n=1 Tax=Colocasia esculenta TaxID=4460 RepID=A0A843VDR0_COLES|nr:hypothetical protein [Colocasia esculenta]
MSHSDRRGDLDSWSSVRGSVPYWASFAKLIPLTSFQVFGSVGGDPRVGYLKGYGKQILGSLQKVPGMGLQQCGLQEWC